MRIKKRMAVYMASTIGAAAIVIPGAIALGGQSASTAANAASTRAVVHLSHDPLHAQAYALTGKKLVLGKNASPHAVQVFSDGCNHNYGTPVQCVPARAPGGKAMTCADLVAGGWLKDGLLVHKDSWGLLATGTYRMTKAGKLLTHC